MIRKKGNIMLRLFIFAIASILCIFNDSLAFSRYVAVATLCVSVINLIHVSKNWYLVIIFMFLLYANYSICMADYLHVAKYSNFLTSLSSDTSAILSINILLLFNSLLFCAIPCSVDVKERETFSFNAKPDVVIFFIICMTTIFIYFWGFTKPVVAGARGEPSTYYEYSIILFIIGMFFCGGNPRMRIVLVFIMGAYILQNLMYGGRATAIQLCMALFLMIFAKRSKILDVIWIIVGGLVIFTSVGSLRANFSLNSNIVFSTIKSLKTSLLVNDTSYAAYFTSQTFIKTLDLISFRERLYLFGQFILSMFLGGGNVIDSNLALYTHQFFMHYYGGILPFFAYFYLGYAGIVILFLYFSWLFRKIIFSHSLLWNCLSVYLVSSVPRWYLYSPSPIFRGLLIFIIVYFAFLFLHRLRCSNGRLAQTC